MPSRQNTPTDPQTLATANTRRSSSRATEALPWSVPPEAVRFPHPPSTDPAGTSPGAAAKQQSWFEQMRCPAGHGANRLGAPAGTGAT